jgi:hypothetical protein
LISNANGTAAYTYVQYDFRGLNSGSDNLSFKMNFTFGDSSYGAGGTGDVARGRGEGYGCNLGYGWVNGHD